MLTFLRTPVLHAPHRPADHHLGVAPRWAVWASRGLHRADRMSGHRLCGQGWSDRAHLVWPGRQQWHIGLDGAAHTHDSVPKRLATAYAVALLVLGHWAHGGSMGNEQHAALEDPW